MKKIYGVYLFLLGIVVGGTWWGPLDRFLHRHQPSVTPGAVAITKPSEDSSVDYCYIETLHEDPSSDDPLGPRKTYEALCGHVPDNHLGRMIPGGFADPTFQRRLTHQEIVAVAAKLGCPIRPKPAF